MNTEGYHKQKANLGTLVLGIPINNSVNTQVKTSAGVEMINVERYTTTFIGSYYRDQLTNQSYLNQKADGMQDIADMFDELSGRGLDTALEDFEKLKSVIKDFGANTVMTTPQEHDKAVALISHAPMLVAQALCKNIESNELAQKLASSGFRDTTRLALSNT